jgi:purine-binding chemotaxis protein CheW
MISDKSQTIHDPLQEELQQFIVIRLGKEIYGIPIEKTREVARFLQITSIPGTASYIMGLMNLHGEILCIVDIKILLNIGNAIPTENSQVVVVKTIEGPVGIFCDEVIDIYSVLKKDIEAPLSTLSSETSIYIQSQVQIDLGLMGILDIERLLFKQEK